jgi:hypothetical protein
MTNVWRYIYLYLSICPSSNLSSIYVDSALCSKQCLHVSKYHMVPHKYTHFKSFYVSVKNKSNLNNNYYNKVIKLTFQIYMD